MGNLLGGQGDVAPTEGQISSELTDHARLPAVGNSSQALKKSKATRTKCGKWKCGTCGQVHVKKKSGNS